MFKNFPDCTVFVGVYLVVFIFPHRNIFVCVFVVQKPFPNMNLLASLYHIDEWTNCMELSK